MSIVRRYRSTHREDGSRLVEYREAWALEGTGQLTVHHGRLGQPGTVKDQEVADDAEAAALLDAFTAQCDEDGFAELAESDVATVSVLYRLRGQEPSAIERRHADSLATEITHQLAWRGLGDVAEVLDHPGHLLLLVRTPHGPKAVAEVPAAAKRAHGVQPNKVEVRLGDVRADDAGQGRP